LALASGHVALLADPHHEVTQAAPTRDGDLHLGDPPMRLEATPAADASDQEAEIEEMQREWRKHRERQALAFVQARENGLQDAEDGESEFIVGSMPRSDVAVVASKMPFVAVKEEPSVGMHEVTTEEMTEGTTGTTGTTAVTAVDVLVVAAPEFLDRGPSTTTDVDESQSIAAELPHSSNILEVPNVLPVAAPEASKRGLNMVAPELLNQGQTTTTECDESEAIVAEFLHSSRRFEAPDVLAVAAPAESDRGVAVQLLLDQGPTTTTEDETAQSIAAELPRSSMELQAPDVLALAAPEAPDEWQWLTKTTEAVDQPAPVVDIPRASVTEVPSGVAREESNSSFYSQGQGQGHSFHSGMLDPAASNV